DQETVDRIARYNQETLGFQMEQIRQERNANILQGIYDGLQTTQSLLTGDAWGVGAGLTRQVATYSEISGNAEVAQGLRTSADITDFAGGVVGLGSMIKDAQKLADDVAENGLKWKNLKKLKADGYKGEKYLNVFGSGTGKITEKGTSMIIAGVAATYAKIANSNNATSASNSTGKVSSFLSVGGSGSSSYTIRSGDTLSSISARTGVSVSVLAKSNGISNPNSIKAGSTISIPSSGGGSSGTSSKAGTTTASKSSSGKK
ncbi:MAG: LysM peptidoglycan-binding domain-containing protein, partial [Luteolibacter sp.]